MSTMAMFHGLRGCLPSGVGAIPSATSYQLPDNFVHGFLENPPLQAMRVSRNITKLPQFSYDYHMIIPILSYYILYHPIIISMLP